MTQQAPTNIKLPERDYIVSGRSPVITVSCLQTV